MTDTLEKNIFITEFTFGDLVYLKTDMEQHERMITGMILRPNNHIVYYVSLSTLETTHYGIELSSTKDVMKLI